MKKIMIVAISLLLAACKKEAPKQYSYWKINGQEYSSNNVEKAIGKAIAKIGGHDINRFSITFYVPYLPLTGNWPITNGTPPHSPDSAIMYFYIDNVIYEIAPNEIGLLSTPENKEKAQYSLAPTWFVNYTDSNDSVLIEGVFNEP